MKNTRLIGQRCKCGNIFSWLILIDRGLDQIKKETHSADLRSKFHWQNTRFWVSLKTYMQFWKNILSKKLLLKNQKLGWRKGNSFSRTFEWVLFRGKIEDFDSTCIWLWCVFGLHPFPFRTGWLSQLQLMVLHGRPCGRVSGSQLSC